MGESTAVRALLAQVDRVAPTDARVLLSGEGGTGKELVAHLVHEQSHRAAGPWVALNCGAIPESLQDSELFGHEKGAFTGANRRRQGCFERADGGTLLLDEIGEVNPATQVRLLRVLQEGAFYRVGGERPCQVDVRVLAATNQDLEEEVREGRFRDDLFYRLNVLPLRIPPLRDRRDDIPPLLDHFLRTQAAALGRPAPSLDAAALRLLEGYAWPGNVRELQNLVERLLILVDADVVRATDLPPEIIGTPGRDPRPARAVTLREVIAETERELVVRALRQTRGRKAAAARLLGISRPTLDKKIRDYDIEINVSI